MTLGALVPVGRACMRVSVFGLGKVAKPCQAMWSVIVVTIEGVTDSRPHLDDRGYLFSVVAVDTAVLRRFPARQLPAEQP